MYNSWNTISEPTIFHVFVNDIAWPFAFVTA